MQMQMQFYGQQQGGLTAHGVCAQQQQYFPLQQGMKQQQQQQQGYGTPQGYYANGRGRNGAEGGLVAAMAAGLAFCCCLNVCVL